MKNIEDFHPDYHLITVVMTDGTSTRRARPTARKATRSTSTSIPSTHPAWTGGNQHMLDRGGRVSRFKKKFEGLF